jgi:hypothetical protein
MSRHDPKATLNQMQEAARRAQEICAGKSSAMISGSESVFICVHLWLNFLRGFVPWLRKIPSASIYVHLR